VNLRPTWPKGGPQAAGPLPPSGEISPTGPAPHVNIAGVVVFGMKATLVYAMVDGGRDLFGLRPRRPVASAGGLRRVLVLKTSHRMPHHAGRPSLQSASRRKVMTRMDPNWLGLVELLLVVGLVFGLAIREVVSLKREKRRDEALKRDPPPRDPPGSA
jgi:hypothetical protein